MAAELRPIWAVKFIETAKPALSSAGETTFEPEDKRASEALNLELDCPSNCAVACADVLVLMTITADSFHESPLAGFRLRDIPATRRLFSRACACFSLLAV
jgi:hypothetical protein